MKLLSLSTKQFTGGTKRKTKIRKKKNSKHLWALTKVKPFIGANIIHSYSLREQIAELKTQEYQYMRQNLEQRLDLEGWLAKEERQHERILQRQQKIMESKAERNEVEFRRQREEVEHEFRRGENEAAIKNMKWLIKLWKQGTFDLRKRWVSSLYL